jgi:hypothetical protein
VSGAICARFRDNNQPFDEGEGRIERSDLRSFPR